MRTLLALWLVASLTSPAFAQLPVRGPDPKIPKLEGELTPVPEGLSDVITLLPLPFTTDVMVQRHSQLSCQILRQGLWLSARENHGLRVLDADLGEVAPDDLPPDRRIKYSPVSNAEHSQWDLFSGFQMVWTGPQSSRSKTFYADPVELMNRSETDTRKLLSMGLASARFPVKPNRRSDAPIPAEAERLLGEMRETAQFAAVRRLHAEMRAKGESDALIGGLVRGYANLGLLTEYQWSPSCAVFQARSLLYAQRLAARSPTATALRHRAYALALAGLHKFALVDLDAAAKLEAKEPAPWWLESLDAFVHFDLDRLAEARKSRDVPFTRFLAYLAVEEPMLEQVTLKAAREYLSGNPECFRVYEAICQTGGLGTLRSTTTNWARAIDESLVRRIQEQDGLPQSVSNVLTAAEFKEETLYAALRKASDPTSDRSEPTFAVLATLTESNRFAQKWHALYTLISVLGVSAEDEAKEAARILAGHPLVPLIERLAIDRSRNSAEWIKQMTSPPANLLDLRARTYGYMLGWYGQDPLQKWMWSAEARNGRGYHDVLRALHFWSFDQWQTVTIVPEFLSPHSPQGIAYNLIRDPKPKAENLAEIEKKYLGFPLVQEGLGIAYDKLGLVNEAARCYERRIEASPDVKVIRRFAETYKRNNKDDLWLKTLERSLEFDDPGLGHAQVRVEIARHFMAKKEFRKADPYALAAADSYAAWALECAGQCKIGLEQWDEANALFRARALRYPTTVFEWYNVTRRYPKTDRPAAEDAVHDYLASIGNDYPPGIEFQVGRFRLMTGKLKEAQARFDSLFDQHKDRMVVLLSAMIADKLGDAEGRDKRLTQAMEVPKEGDTIWPAYRTVLAMLQGFAAKKDPPDAAAVEAALKGLSPFDRANAKFFIGWWLQNHGESDRAVELWKDVLKTEDGIGWLKTHVVVFLEEHEK